MAHERGLVELAAEFISVTDKLALASAHAVFKDGKKFLGCRRRDPEQCASHK